MNRIFHFTIILLILGSFSELKAQEEIEKETEEGKHVVALLLGHSRIGQGRSSEGKKQFTMVPSFALDYSYWFSKKFALGIQTDFVNENYFIETGEEDGVVERERPIAPTITGSYKFGKHWNVSLGFGGEFAKGENYFVSRLSLEYGVEISNGWEMVAVLSQDVRSNIYDVTVFAVGIAKRF
ncbi:hypothetical protein [Algoriphagus halophilus]|nr:hypothetical protein [Algoriphagus halophilus]